MSNTVHHVVIQHYQYQENLRMNTSTNGFKIGFALLFVVLLVIAIFTGQNSRQLMIGIAIFIGLTIAGAMLFRGLGKSQK
jgi:hypothetical protein